MKDKQQLMFESEELFKQYKAAIANDLPFQETKTIYLRLKEIKKLQQQEEKAALAKPVKK